MGAAWRWSVRIPDPVAGHFFVALLRYQKAVMLAGGGFGIE
jgi:hypothetical protein